jgi:ABC-type polysaccharide/polyol phosphate export permease
MKRFIGDIKKYYKYAIYSGKAELKSEIAQSHLSWMWWILDPLLFMCVYTFVSLIVFGKAEQYFSAFIFIGYTSFKFFEKTVKGSVRLVKANRSIVSKVYIPKHVLLFTQIYVNCFTSGISFLLVFCTMALYRVPLTWNIIFFIPEIILLVMISFALGTVMMHFGVFVEDLSNVTFIVLRLLFYMSGVFYSIEKRIDSQLLRVVLLDCNPIAFIINQMRNSLLYGKPLDIGIYAIWFVISIIIASIGIRLVYRNENGYIKVM